MGILTRMLTLWKADLHGVMDQIEDKPLLLKQYLREMEADLQRKAARLEWLARTGVQLQRDVDARERESVKLEEDLDLALRKEKDDIARMLIRKGNAQRSAREALRRQIQSVEEERRQLAETVARQRLQYDQLKIKAATAGRQADQSGREQTGSACPAEPAWAPPGEEEIELELIRRKEALRKGGDA